MNLRCAETGISIESIGDAVWDDGEWISWDYINGEIDHAEEGELLERMILMAKEYFEFTGRHLPIYGEIGELYAQRRFGIVRHREYAQGSDGKIGDVFVEIKTITPMKSNDVVVVKRAGNFGKLVVVKIDSEFRCAARIMDRSCIAKGSGRLARVAWSSMDPQE